ncbi:MAG: tetratricopeptide repeat protein, partial [Thermoguttaceae bacterium]
MSKQKKSSHKRAFQIESGSLVRTGVPLRALLGAAIILVAALFCYFPSLSGGFLWDDDRLLTESRIIKASDGLHRIWCSTEAVDFWPATNILLWIEWRLWGMNPAGYHVTNLITHVAAAWLIWINLQKLSIPGAFLAALIFAVHPVNVESVAWITQQDNTLAMLFFLISILWYLKGMRRAASKVAPGRLKGAGRETASGIIHPSSFIPHPSSFYWLSLTGFALAMLSKGLAAVLPVLLLGIVWWRRRVTLWDAARTLPFFLVAAALAGVNIWFQTHGSGEVYRTAGFVERLLGAGGVIWFYLYKALLPFDLAYVYPQWEIQSGRVLWWLPLLSALAVTAVLWRYKEKWSRPFLFAWGFFCVSLLPVMGFTDVEYMECSLVANHYQYIAMIGVISLAAAGWSAWRRQMQGPARWVGGGAAGVLAGTLIVLSWQQSRLYSNAILLYQETLKNNPQSYIVHNSLGIALNDAGQREKAVEQFKQAMVLKPDYLEARNNLGAVLNNMGRTQDAIKIFKQALLLKPDYPDTLNNLGTVLNAAGRPDEAIKYIEQALRLKPDYPEALCSMGLVLSNSGRPQEAIILFEKALRLKSNYPEAHYNLGLALGDVGRRNEAIEHFRQALLLKPDYADVYNSLGVLLGQAGRSREAIEHFRQALHFNPNMYGAENNLGNALSDEGSSDEAIGHYEQALRLKPDYLQAHINLADTLVKAGQLPKAIEHYEQALRLKPDSAEACFNLALTYARTKRPGEAVASAQKALELARSQGRMELA